MRLGLIERRVTAETRKLLEELSIRSTGTKNLVVSRITGPGVVHGRLDRLSRRLTHTRPQSVREQAR